MVQSGRAAACERLKTLPGRVARPCVLPSSVYVSFPFPKSMRQWMTSETPKKRGGECISNNACRSGWCKSTPAFEWPSACAR